MFFEEKSGKIILNVRLTPNASARRICGVFVDAEGKEYLKISVIAVPEKGKANKELAAFLADVLQVAKMQIKLLYGETDRYKKLEISGEPAIIAEKLSALAR